MLKRQLARSESRIKPQDRLEGRTGIANLAIRGCKCNERRWLCADEPLQPCSGLEHSLALSEETVDRCAEYETNA